MGREEHSTADAQTHRSTGTQDQSKKQTRDAADQEQHAAHKTQEKGKQVVSQAQQEAKAQLSSQKDRAAQQLGTIGSALHETSGSLREKDEDAVAQYVDQAGHQVDRLADYLRHRSVGDLMHEAQDFARRDPALFIGGAALLGLAGARFFKSSQSSQEGVQPHQQRARADYYRTPREPEYRMSREQERTRVKTASHEDGYSEVRGTSGEEMPASSRSVTRTPEETTGTT